MSVLYHNIIMEVNGVTDVLAQRVIHGNILSYFDSILQRFSSVFLSRPLRGLLAWGGDGAQAEAAEGGAIPATRG